MNKRPEDDDALQKLRAANRLQRALLQMGMAQHLEGVLDPRERSAIVHSITRDLTSECNRCGGLFREAEMINDGRDLLHRLLAL